MMTKEQQKASAASIMAKLGPLTGEELSAYVRLQTDPSQYPKDRVCLDCGEAFRKEQTFEHAEHLATHYPNGSQWAQAHKMIEAGKDRAKHSQ
jgi:hypothetical protein